MKTRKVPLLIVLLTLSSSVVPAFAQGTTFTYQGQLTDGGTPANGLYDFRFSVMDLPDLGVPLDLQTTNGVPVNNGLFTVTLDFGGELFDGSPRWLEIEVKSNNVAGPYTLLSPRQELTATPYAILAGSISGPLPETGLSGAYSSPVTIDNPANLFTGSFTGNGGELTNVNAGTLEGLTAAGFWRVSGNTDTSPGTHFLGTIDNQPLEVRVNNARILRLEPTTGAPNIIGGAEDNLVSDGVTGAAIGGGSHNSAGAVGDTVGGGYWNHAVGGYSVVDGGEGNTASGYHAFTGGGQLNLATNSNSTVVGGLQNLAGGEGAFVGGGMGNTASGDAAFVGGGGKDWKYGSIYPNQASGLSSVVGGGVGNYAGAIYSFIGGGGNNTNSTSSIYGVIGGGAGNTVANTAATIGGGWENTATGGNSTVAGGSGNLAGIGAETTVGGGYHNAATNSYSTVPGGESNLAGGRYSFAAGRRAKAIHEGSFVWADARDLDYYSTRTNEFSIRAEGGVRIDSKLGIKLNDIDQPLITRGWFPFTSGAYEGVGRFGLFMEPWTLTAGLPTHAATKFEVVSYNEDSTINQHLMVVDQTGTVTATAFNPPSDRAAKEQFESVDGRQVLERLSKVPISRWRFKQEPTVPHIGPVAQDFYAAFGVGTDNKHIATVDADGVALAAIQGLNQKLEQKEAEIAKLEAELAKLKQVVQSLVLQNDGGVQ